MYVTYCIVLSFTLLNSQVEAENVWVCVKMFTVLSGERMINKYQCWPATLSNLYVLTHHVRRPCSCLITWTTRWQYKTAVSRQLLRLTKSIPTYLTSFFTGSRQLHPEGQTTSSGVRSAKQQETKNFSAASQVSRFSWVHQDSS